MQPMLVSGGSAHNRSIRAIHRTKSDTFRTRRAAGRIVVPSQSSLGEHMNDALIESLLRAVQAAPGDLPLRIHLAELMLGADRPAEAVAHLAMVLSAEPGNRQARALLSEAFAVRLPARFDWHKAEADLRGELDRPAVTLADVGGLRDVKDRLSAAILTRGGGLMLYGPPGCGKTFLAKAIAGELGAGFLAVSLADERDPHEVFERARRSAPCVLFLAEVDAIGQRATVEKLLIELDGIAYSNAGVFVLAATNAPWDVDVALRRPGRLDRTALVLPPDTDAREAILRYHLGDRYLTGIDLGKLAARTDGMTGADLADVCETAAERALLDSAATGVVRQIEMRDLNAALAEIRPSARIWFDTARYLAGSGEWDELLRYLRRNAGPDVGPG